MIEPNQNRAKPSLEYISWGVLHLKWGIISTERLVGDIFLDICCDINTHSSYCIGCQNMPLSLAKRAHCYKKFTDTGKRGIEKNLRSWWRHQMETFSNSLTIYAGNSSMNSHTKARDGELWCFLWSVPEKKVNNGEAGYLRRHRVHYDVTVMCLLFIWC